MKTENQLVILGFPEKVNLEGLKKVIAKFAESQKIHECISIHAMSHHELFPGSTCNYESCNEQTEYTKSLDLVNEVLANKKGDFRTNFMRLYVEGAITPPILKILIKGPSTAYECIKANELHGAELANISAHILDMFEE